MEFHISLTNFYVRTHRLLRLLRKERALILSLTSLGLSPGEAVDLLTHPAIGDAQSTKGVTDGLFDASDRLEEGKAIVYWNDIEKDKRYVPLCHSVLNTHSQLGARYSSWNPSIHLVNYFSSWCRTFIADSIHFHSSCVPCILVNIPMSDLTSSMLSPSLTSPKRAASLSLQAPYRLSSIAIFRGEWEWFLKSRRKKVGLLVSRVQPMSDFSRHIRSEDGKTFLLSD